MEAAAPYNPALQQVLPPQGVGLLYPVVGSVREGLVIGEGGFEGFRHSTVEGARVGLQSGEWFRFRVNPKWQLKHGPHYDFTVGKIDALSSNNFAP